jgi:hypothetical protein
MFRNGSMLLTVNSIGNLSLEMIHLPACQDGGMRTTVDLSAELMHAANARAAERGETLSDLVTRAVARELRILARSAYAGRVSLPLVGRDASPSVIVTNAGIEAALDAEDAVRYAGR